MSLQGVARDTQKKYHFCITFPDGCFTCVLGVVTKTLVFIGFDGESAGARTQDQRLKRAMLYQLSYALKPHYQVSTFGLSNFHPQITTVQSLTRIAFLLKNSRSIWRSLSRKYENRTRRIEPGNGLPHSVGYRGNNTSSISGTVNDPYLSCIAPTCQCSVLLLGHT